MMDYVWQLAFLGNKEAIRVWVATKLALPNTPLETVTPRKVRIGPLMPRIDWALPMIKGYP